MKKFLALGLLGVSHACDPAVRTDCYEDSSGSYQAAGDKVLTNLVLIKDPTTEKYNISDCDGSPKEWGNVTHGNVVECGITADKLAPGLDLKEDYDNGQGGTYSRILMAPTTAMCDSLTDSSDPTLGAVCTGGSFTGTLIADADAIECANDACTVVDTQCCHECTGDSYLDEATSSCKSGIEETSDGKFISLSALRSVRSDAAKDRLNDFYRRFKLKYDDSGRSDFTLFSPTDFKDTRDALKPKQSIQIKRMNANGVEINRRTFGRIKMTEEQARAAKIIITKDDNSLEELEFEMVHADGDPDYQSFGFGDFDILCQTTSNITATCGADQRRRLSGGASCFQGAEASYDNALEVWTFTPGDLEFSQTCAVSETGGQYTISPCAIGTDNVQSLSRSDLPWAPYSVPLICSLCPSGSGVVSGTESAAECEVCSADDEFNSKLDNSECDSCPTYNTDTLISDGSDLCLCKTGYYGTGVTHQVDDCHECASIANAATRSCNAAGAEGIVSVTCEAGSFETGTAGVDLRCETCGNGGSSYTCGSGQYITGTPCSGSGSSDTQSCGTCGNGGSSYSCGSGNYKTGTACTGSGGDTQTCSGCGNGGSSYSCGSGNYKTGTACTGSGGDTQSCGTCSNGGLSYSCGFGNYKTGTACTGSGGDTQSCGTCSNGGSSYFCGLGNYKTGTACAGSGGDTQSCEACTTCGLGEHTGTPCSGSGTSDTQFPCVACPKGEYNDDAPAADTCKSCGVDKYTTDTGKDSEDDCKPCSGFSTEWINSQCCGGISSDHCGMLNGQCETSCSVGSVG